MRFGVFCFFFCKNYDRGDVMKYKILSAFLCVCSLIGSVSFSVSASEDTVFHWYCVRNHEHKQPIADANMRWIETYGGYYIDRVHGDDSQEKVVYLTFDAGYENGNVEKILNVMKGEEVIGAFFVLGNLIQKNPELIRRMAEEGHLVCNHTVRHKDMSKIDDETVFCRELQELEQMYQEVTGKEMAKYYRPPEGTFDERSLRFASNLGYRTVFWSLAYADWDNQKQPDPEQAKALLLKYMHNGAVILLHPTSRTNATILKDLIVTLKAQGFRFGSLDELCGNEMQG